MIGKLRDKLTFANAMSCVAVFIALSGTAYAAFRVPPNSVGSRQLKAKAVTGGKIANATISGGKLEPETITGSDVKLSALGTVPMAADSESAANSNTVGGHAASCPTNTTLIRGLCFDTHPNPAVATVQKAAEGCASKGGWLPTPLQLYAVKNILDLGEGVGSEHQFTDAYYYDATNNDNPSTVVIDGAGQIEQVGIEHNPEEYTCVYPLVR